MLDHRFYNPSLLTDAELRQSFVIRGRQLKKLVDVIQTQPLSGSLHHVLIVGPRGSGKTTLGLRLMLAIQDDASLANRWQPVPFFEESYGITDLAGIWLAALKHLSDATKDSRWAAKAETLLRDGESNSRRLEASALAALVDFCQENHKRLVLLVENLDQIFSQFLNTDDFYKLRAALQERSDILIVGTASSIFDEISKHDQPFYEFFQIIRLPSLTRQETNDYVTSMLAVAPNSSLAQALRSDPTRLDTIRRFTGGNPRLIALSARMISESPNGAARDDLERLIDEQTPYFKARIEQLPPQSRAVFHVLAEGWRPMLAREVAEAARLPTSQASAQLKKLHTLSYVETVSAKDKKVRYQVLERFYNIYYLLRFTRSQKDRLARLIEFITQVFGLQAAAGMAEATLTRLKGSPLRDDWAAMAALAPYLREPLVQSREIFRAVLKISNTQGDALPNDLLSAAWESVLKDDKDDEVALSECVIASRKFLSQHPHETLERARLALGLARLRREDEVFIEMEILLNEADANKDKTSQDAIVNVTALLPMISSSLTIAEIHQCDIVKRFPQSARAKEILAKTLYLQEKNKEALDLILSIEEQVRSAEAWALLAGVYISLDRYPDADLSAEKAIQLDEGNVDALFALGGSKFEAGNYDAAEHRLTEATRLRPAFDSAWIGLANTKLKLGKTDEAELILTGLAQRNPQARNWNAIGDFYHGLNRDREAALAYKKSIELNPSDDATYVNLALAQQDFDEEEAQKSLKLALELNPKNVRGHIVLGILSDDDDEGIKLIRQSIQFASAEEQAIASSLLALRYDRISEALEITQTALASSPNSTTVLAMTSYVLARAGRWEDALRNLALFSRTVKSNTRVPGTVTEALIEAEARGLNKEVLAILEESAMGELLEPLLHAAREELGLATEPLPVEIANAVAEIRERIHDIREERGFAARELSLNNDSSSPSD